MAAQPVMVGERYVRVRGPELICEVVALRDDQAICRMTSQGRSYGRRPVPIELLHTEVFHREEANR